MPRPLPRTLLLLPAICLFVLGCGRHGGESASSPPLPSTAPDAGLTAATAALLAAIQAWPDGVASEPICYAPEVYPYWFVDLDGDGTCSDAEASATNPYQAWTRPMQRAAWALESYQRDPGAWAHDFRGMSARLADAITGLGGAAGG